LVVTDQLVSHSAALSIQVVQHQETIAVAVGLQIELQMSNCLLADVPELI
jgi:hypothetical protein